MLSNNSITILNRMNINEDQQLKHVHYSNLKGVLVYLQVYTNLDIKHNSMSLVLFNLYSSIRGIINLISSLKILNTFQHSLHWTMDHTIHYICYLYQIYDFYQILDSIPCSSI